MNLSVMSFMGGLPQEECMSAEAYYPPHRCVKRASFKNTAPPKDWRSERGEAGG